MALHSGKSSAVRATDASPLPRWAHLGDALKPNHAREARMAMLTGLVNIAVFAAFSFCIGGDLLSNAAFKPVCGSRQLDVSRDGRQERHDRGKKRQQSGKVHGKNGAIWYGCGGVHAATCAVAGGCDGLGLGEYAVVKVLARLGGRVIMELKYHKMSGVSRGAVVDCRAGKGIAATLACDTDW